jgi:hypothetical protein
MNAILGGEGALEWFVTSKRLALKGFENGF